MSRLREVAGELNAESGESQFVTGPGDACGRRRPPALRSACRRRGYRRRWISGWGSSALTRSQPGWHGVW